VSAKDETNVKQEWRNMSATQTSTRTGLDALLTPENSLLILIDHQPFQFANLRNMDPTLVLNNTIGLAKAAKAFGVPTILTTVIQDRGGFLPKELQNVFPDQKPIDRTTVNTWEDPRVVEAVEKTGRKKLVIAGLWTEVCLAMPVIHALGEGYDVFAVTDASGGASVEAHERAVQRMVQAGAVPITWMAVLSEWQRDWAREATVPALGEILLAHGGSTGTSFAWELQLLSASSAKK
jgi:nicotinamidase-related amidase